MKIALDLDGTLLDSSYIFRDVIKKYDINYLPPIDYNFTNYPIKAKKEILDRWKTDHYSIYALPFYKGVFETLNNWRTKHELFIITARYNVNKTKQFLNVLTGIPLDNIYVSHDKLSIIQSLGINLWIDDNPFDLIKVFNSGVRCIKINHEYNRNLNGIIYGVDNISQL